MKVQSKLQIHAAYCGAAVLVLGGALLPTAAYAHVGGHNAFGFTAGFFHPLSGLDHVLAMLAVGILAGFMGNQARWTLPCAFLVAMLAGGGLGIVGIGTSIAEVGIAASLIVFGLLLSSRVRLHSALAASIVVGFAVFHGLAHGHEMPVAATAVAYGLGFVAATAMLHGFGIGIGHLFARFESAPAIAMQRLSGVAIAVAGVSAAMSGI